MTGHVLLVGGEDHELRFPFILGLRAAGLRVTAAGTGDAGPFARAAVDYHRFAFDRFIDPAADMRAIGQLRRLLATVQPDIVHSFDTKPNLLVPLAASRCRNLRVVRTINGLGWLFSSRQPLPMALRPVFCALHRQAAKSAALTVFQNRADRAFFARHRMIGPGASRVIAGSGVDPRQFHDRLAAAASACSLRRELGLHGAEVVITVSRVTRQKGIPTLLKAADLVHRVRPGARFLIVGPWRSEGRDAVPPDTIARHAPHVIATGKRQDVPALLAMADVFAFPTEYREGVPRALLEAALARLPIVATDMPGCNDVVTDGWSGLLTPPRDPPALARGILSLLQDPDRARAMADRAARIVADGFSLSGTIGNYASAYAELLQHPAGYGVAREAA